MCAMKNAIGFWLKSLLIIGVALLLIGCSFRSYDYIERKIEHQVFVVDSFGFVASKFLPECSWDGRLTDEIFECEDAFALLKENYPEYFPEMFAKRSDYRIVWELAHNYQLDMEWILKHQWDYRRGSGGVRNFMNPESMMWQTFDGKLSYEELRLLATNGYTYSFVGRNGDSVRTWRLPYKIECKVGQKTQVSIVWLSNNMLEEAGCT